MTALLLLALAGPGTPSSAALPPLARAEDAYRAGQLDHCEALLDGLLLPGRTLGPGDLGRALVLRAAVAFARGNAATAREDLVQAHGEPSGVALPPELFPPDFRDFDLTVQREEATRIAKLQARPAAAAPEAAISGAAPRRTAVPRPDLVLTAPPPEDSALWALVPLGVPQRRRGAVAWGDTLGVAQVAALAVGLGSLGVDLALRNPSGLYLPAQAPLARALNVSYLVGCYAALGLYAVGVVDGLAFGHAPPTP